jgi:thiosulfate reductase cytochrome b subunit
MLDCDWSSDVCSSDLPLMVLTGLSMSPGFNAAAPGLIDVFGGRQGARSVHFICAGLVVLFVLVHVALVLVSGVWNNMRSMVTGKYAIETEGGAA